MSANALTQIRLATISILPIIRKGIFKRTKFCTFRSPNRICKVCIYIMVEIFQKYETLFLLELDKIFLTMIA